MSTNNIARRVSIIGTEASCLPGDGRRSFPIEIAAGIPDTGAVRSWLIKPERIWLEEWDWYYEAEQLHRLTRDHLLARGLPRQQVARELGEFILDREVVSDNPAAEGHWLAVLYGEEKPRRVGSLLLIYAAITGVSERGKAVYRRAEIEAYRTAPPTHRAGDDVRHELVKLRVLLRLMHRDAPA